jgi:hypothetical protein
MSDATHHRFPARDHARKVVAELLNTSASEGQEQAILLQGSPVLTRDDTDHELPFRKTFR